MPNLPNPPDHHRVVAMPLAGWVYHAGPALAPAIEPGEALALVREPDNPHDRHAVAVHCRGRRIGYVPAAVAEDFAALARRDDLAVRASDGYADPAGDRAVWVVTEFEVWAPVPEVLRQLNVPRLPPDVEYTPLLLAASEGRLLTMLPPACTAAGRGADASAELGWRADEQLLASTGGRYDRDATPPSWPAYRRVYLVREPATATHFERVSVWLAGSRLIGFLRRDDGLELVEAHAARPPFELWCVLSTRPSPTAYSADAGQDLSLSLCRTTAAEYERASAKTRGQVLSAELRATDLTQLAEGARRDWERLGPPVPHDDDWTMLAHDTWPGCGPVPAGWSSGPPQERWDDEVGAVDADDDDGADSPTDGTDLPAGVDRDESRYRPMPGEAGYVSHDPLPESAWPPAPPAIAHLRPDGETGIRFFSDDDAGVARGRYRFAEAYHRFPFEPDPAPVPALDPYDFTSALGYDALSGAGLRDFLDRLARVGPEAASDLTRPFADQVRAFGLWWARLPPWLARHVHAYDAPRFDPIGWHERTTALGTRGNAYAWWWLTGWHRLEGRWAGLLAQRFPPGGATRPHWSRTPPPLLGPLDRTRVDGVRAMRYLRLACVAEGKEGVRAPAPQAVLQLRGVDEREVPKFTLAGLLAVLRAQGWLPEVFPHQVAVREAAPVDPGAGVVADYEVAVRVHAYSTYDHSPVGEHAFRILIAVV